MKFTQFILLEVEQKLEIFLPKAFSMFCYEKQKNFGLLSSSPYNQTNFLLIFFSIYEYIKTIFFWLRFKFSQTFNFFDFHPKSCNRNKIHLCFHSLLLSRLKQTIACFIWNKTPNCSVANCTLLVGLEPSTFRLTAERASRLRHKS